MASPLFQTTEGAANLRAAGGDDLNMDDERRRSIENKNRLGLKMSPPKRKGEDGDRKEKPKKDDTPEPTTIPRDPIPLGGSLPPLPSEVALGSPTSPITRALSAGEGMTPEETYRQRLLRQIAAPGASYEGPGVGIPVYRGAGNQSYLADASRNALMALDRQQAGLAKSEAERALLGAQAASEPIHAAAEQTIAETGRKKAETEIGLMKGTGGGLDPLDAAGNPIGFASDLEALERAHKHPVVGEFMKKEADPITAAIGMAQSGAFGSGAGDPRGTTGRHAFLQAKQQDLIDLVKNPGFYNTMLGSKEYGQFLDIMRKYFPEVAAAINPSSVSSESAWSQVAPGGSGFGQVLNMITGRGNAPTSIARNE